MTCFASAEMNEILHISVMQTSLAQKIVNANYASYYKKSKKVLFNYAKKYWQP
jgi:hypothetical protein